MKQPTPYPRQRQQILARILLTIWLPTTCSPEATLAAPPSEVAAASTIPCTSGSSTPPMGSPEKIRLIAQGGHQVTVQRNNDKWQAEVEEDLLPGSSHKLSLPVIIQEGMAWQQLATCSEALQRQRVVVDSTPDNRHVHIDTRGLWRGDTPLYEVINQGALTLVPEILAQRGSDTNKNDINTVDDQRRSALHWAVIKGYKAIAVLLIKHGADVTLKDHQENKTPLDYANNKDRQYLSTIAVLAQLFSTLNNLIEDGIIKNQGDIDQKLNEVWMGLGKLEQAGPKGEEQCRYFKYRYYIQRAKYLRALGDEEEAYHQEELAEKYKKPNISFLSLDAALQETMAAPGVSSQNAGQFLDNQKADKSFHQEQGDDKWREFMEYWYAQQGQWAMLTRLGRENPDHQSPGQKDALKGALRAHEFYGASCHAADRAKDLHSEINLRAIMALRLLTIGYFLEAKMYALSVCSKLINNPDSKVRDLRKAQELLVRVQEAQLACGDRQTITNSTTRTLNIFQKLNYHHNRYPTLTVQEGYSHTENLDIKCAIAQDLQEVARELLLSNARNIKCYHIRDRDRLLLLPRLVDLDPKCAMAEDLQEIAQELLLSSAYNLPAMQVPEARIFQMEQLAKRYNQSGIRTGIAGVILLCFLIVVGGYALFKFMLTKKKNSTPRPKHVWISRLAATITGILGVLALMYGRSLWNKGERVRQESIACRGINERLWLSQACYDKKKLHEDLDRFTPHYDSNKSLEENEERMSIYRILTPKERQIQQAGLAYIINLIGKYLKDVEVNMPDDSDSDDPIFPTIEFSSLVWEELKQLAQGLDTSVEERLKALRHIAKLDLTTVRMKCITRYRRIDLLKKDKLADQLLKEAREAIEFFLQLYATPGISLAVIKDYLKVINDHCSAITT